MLLGMFERDAVLNRSLGGCVEREETQKEERERAHQASNGSRKTHRAFASRGTASAEPSFLSSFSHKPSKLPFDMIRSKSPAFASPARCSAIASELGKTRASLPSFRTSAATASGSMRFSSPNC